MHISLDRLDDVGRSNGVNDELIVSWTPVWLLRLTNQVSPGVSRGVLSVVIFTSLNVQRRLRFESSGTYTSLFDG